MCGIGKGERERGNRGMSIGECEEERRGKDRKGNRNGAGGGETRKMGEIETREEKDQKTEN